MSREVVWRLLVSLIVAASLVLGGAHLTATGNSVVAAAPGMVRATLRVGVWTLWHDRSVTIAPSAPGRKIALRSCDQCAPRFIGSPSEIRADGDAIRLSAAGRSVAAQHIWMTGPASLTAHNETIALDYPIEIVARQGILCIVVTLPVEDYVQRVVASESGPADRAESLKALAIVVRSFALHVRHGHADYDLCDSTHCQLLHWRGNGDRQAAAHAATLATAGETLWFHGRRALAYFSKDCGGHTASPVEIWPKSHPLAYLPSQPDRFCSGSGSEWATELTRAELTAALAAGGVARPGWKSLTIARRGDSGRVVTVRLDGAEISAEDFRLAVGQALGWNRLPSTWFEVSRQDERFLFHGRGMGHGVGLCQKGAATMAAQPGRTAREILAQYFPGAEPADESSGAAWKQLGGDGFRLESLDAGDAAYLPKLARARALAEQRSGLHIMTPVTVRAFASTTAFRDATLAPGWVGAFTEGDWIGTQPLRTLAARHLLDATLLHEFVHAFVEQQAGPRTPLWLREGLAEIWSEPGRKITLPPALAIDAVDSALAHAATEAESEAAHRAAGWYAARLFDRYGRAQVLYWLRSGVPAEVIVTLGQR